MKFPICYCVKTEWLDFKSYCLLVAKLGTEGYKNPYAIGGGGKDAFGLGGIIGVMTMVTLCVTMTLSSTYPLMSQVRMCYLNNGWRSI